MIWLVGSGPMSIDYAKVLDALDQEFIVIGRGNESARSFTAAIGREVYVGGVDSFLESHQMDADCAIVSVGVAQLYETTLKLIEHGIPRILVEKPAGLELNQISNLVEKSREYKCEVFVAYNRRFLSSVSEARKLIALDDGIESFSFEFTEWSHLIEKLGKSQDVLCKWFIANSTHVVDLAFSLAGQPKEIVSLVKGGLSWHPSASLFAGTGVTERNALFSYSANWTSAGRWSLEICTNKNRYIFRPLEKLQIQKRGEISIKDIEIDDDLDIRFKPGLYKQVEAFILGSTTELCSLDEQLRQFRYFELIGGYADKSS